VVLGAAFGWAIPMAFMAILQTVPEWAWLLFFANLLWTVAYDTMYAMVDRDDDLLVGVKSTAILFGRNDIAIIGALQVTVIVLLLAVGAALEAGVYYYSALVVCALLFARQLWQIRERDREACFRAFLENHYVGLVYTIGLMGEFLL
jgi:4-hydroxybenzoate polyprenyltransferase